MGIFNNYTVAFELNRADSDFDSFITFNGVNSTNIVGGKYGVVYRNSSSDESWKFNLQEARLGENPGKGRFDDNRSSVGGAVIATASPFLEIPFTDFINLQGEIFKTEKSLKQNISTNLYYIPNKKCSEIDLKPLVLKIDDLEFVIPSYYYTKQDNYFGYKCYL